MPICHSQNSQKHVVTPSPTGGILKQKWLHTGGQRIPECCRTIIQRRVVVTLHDAHEVMGSRMMKYTDFEEGRLWTGIFLTQGGYVIFQVRCKVKMQRPRWGCRSQPPLPTRLQAQPTTNRSSPQYCSLDSRACLGPGSGAGRGVRPLPARHSAHRGAAGRGEMVICA